MLKHMDIIPLHSPRSFVFCCKIGAFTIYSHTYVHRFAFYENAKVRALRSPINYKISVAINPARFMSQRATKECSSTTIALALRGLF